VVYLPDESLVLNTMKWTLLETKNVPTMEVVRDNVIKGFSVDIERYSKDYFSENGSTLPSEAEVEYAHEINHIETSLRIIASICRWKVMNQQLITCIYYSKMCKDDKISLQTNIRQWAFSLRSKSQQRRERKSFTHILVTHRWVCCSNDSVELYLENSLLV